MFTICYAFHIQPGKMSNWMWSGGEQTLSINVPAIEESHKTDKLSEMIDPDKSRVRQLGIIGIAIDAQTADNVSRAARTIRRNCGRSVRVFRRQISSV